jgi:molybdenum cofactor synthesis domain-containing protein
MPTAAGIIIGDEILSGKVQDTNAYHLIRMLHDAGVELVRISTIGDDPTCIAEEVNLCRGRCDHVLTSGGVGPTHDDRTMEGIARAFGRKIVRHPHLEKMVRSYWAERVNEAALKLAEVPEGAELLESDDGMLPVVTLENVFILPGIPQIFEAKLLRVRQVLSGQVAVLHSIYLNTDESSIAEVLTRVDRELAEIKIGSYPRIGDPDHRVRVTVESTSAEAAERGLQRLLELLPADRIVRVE